MDSHIKVPSRNPIKYVISAQKIGTGKNSSLAMGRPRLQILKPGTNLAQTMAGPTRTQPNPKKPRQPKQPKLCMNSD